MKERVFKFPSLDAISAGCIVKMYSYLVSFCRKQLLNKVCNHNCNMIWNLPILILLPAFLQKLWSNSENSTQIIPNVKLLRCYCKWFFNLIDKSKSNVTFPKTPSGGQKSTTLMMIMMIAPSLFFLLTLNSCTQDNVGDK